MKRSLIQALFERLRDSRVENLGPLNLVRGAVGTLERPGLHSHAERGNDQIRIVKPSCYEPVMKLHISIYKAMAHFFTRRGEPMAGRIGTGEIRRLTGARRAARERMRKRMAEGYALGGEKLDRDAVYER